MLATADNSQNDAGFDLLFAYISGSNKARDKIPMTAPVITSQKIPMTSPVVSNATSMSFVLPAGKTREETPDPLDRPGSDRDTSGTGGSRYPLHGICIPTRGGCGNGTVAGRTKKDGIETVGQPFLMRYDTPWIPGFLRRNEVGTRYGGKPGRNKGKGTPAPCLFHFFPEFSIRS